MKRIISAVLVLTLSLSFILAGCSGGTAATPSSGQDTATGSAAPSTNNKANEVILSTYTMGGFWYVLGGGIMDVAGKNNANAKITLVEGTGSLANIMGCHTGQYQLGFSWAPALKAAYEGSQPYSEKMENVRVVAAFYDGCAQFVVDKDSDIVTFGDLKGKKVAPTTKGSETEVLIRNILSLYDLTYEDLARVDFSGLSDAVSQMKDGHLDCVGATLPVPASALTEADSGMGVKLVALDDALFAKLAEINPAYGRKTIPAGTYSGQKEDVDAVSYPVILIANKDVPDDVVYDILKACFDQKDTLAILSKDLSTFSPEYAYKYCSELGPIHPGALKLYQELGVAK